MECGGLTPLFLRPRLLTEAIFRRNWSEQRKEKREQAPALQKTKSPDRSRGALFYEKHYTTTVMRLSSPKLVKVQIFVSP